MEVAYWQVFVFGTVALATAVFGARAGLYVAIAWTVFTAIMVYTSQLAILQLGTTWIAYLLFRDRGLKKDRIASQEVRISKLESALNEALSSYDEHTKERATKAIKHANYRVIRDKQHRKELLSAVSNAKESLLIVSGWIRSYAVDEEFLSLLAKALKRGVDVLIEYGWQKPDGTHDSDKSIAKARYALGKLAEKSRIERGWGRLTIVEKPTHEKLIVKDTDFVIFGSNNWLSNRQFRNREQSIKILDEKLAQELGMRYWSAVQ